MNTPAITSFLYQVGDVIRHFERATTYRIIATPETFQLRGSVGGWEPGYVYISLADNKQYARTQSAIEDGEKYGIEAHAQG